MLILLLIIRFACILSEVGHGGSGSAAAAGCGEAATTMIGAKGGPFPSIGTMGRLDGSSVVT